MFGNFIGRETQYQQESRKNPLIVEKPLLASKLLVVCHQVCASLTRYFGHLLFTETFSKFDFWNTSIQKLSGDPV